MSTPWQQILLQGFIVSSFKRHPDPTKTTLYPLHLVCLNSQCHCAISVELVKRDFATLYHMCILGSEIHVGEYYHTLVESMPLHYYLSRTCNVNLDLVKLFMKSDAPLHMLCCNPGVNDMLLDILKFLIASDHFDGGYGRVPS